MLLQDVQILLGKSSKNLLAIAELHDEQKNDEYNEGTTNDATTNTTNKHFLPHLVNTVLLCSLLSNILEEIKDDTAPISLLSQNTEPLVKAMRAAQFEAQRV